MQWVSELVCSPEHKVRKARSGPYLPRPSRRHAREGRRGRVRRRRRFAFLHNVDQDTARPGGKSTSWSSRRNGCRRCSTSAWATRKLWNKLLAGIQKVAIIKGLYEKGFMIRMGVLPPYQHTEHVHIHILSGKHKNHGARRRADARCQLTRRPRRTAKTAFASQHRADVRRDLFDRVRRRPEGQHSPSGHDQGLDGQRRVHGRTRTRAGASRPEHSQSRDLLRPAHAQASRARSPRFSARAFRRSSSYCSRARSISNMRPIRTCTARLRGCAVGALGLTIGNALELSWDERDDWIKISLLVLTAIVVAWIKMPLLLVLVDFRRRRHRARVH